MSSLRACLCAFALFVGSCASATSLRITFRSDSLLSGQDVDAVEVVVTSDAGDQGMQRFPLTGQWPQSVVIRPRDPSALPGVVMLRARAMLGDRVVAQTEFNSAFQQDKIVDIEMWFDADCRTTGCHGDSMCVDGTCVASSMPDAGMGDATVPDADSAKDAGPEAGPEAGLEAGLDAGLDGAVDMAIAPDAGCVPSAETCNDRDDDCDDLVDEGVLCPGSVLISEVSTGQTGGALDEFVELYNRTDHPIRIDGARIYYASSGTAVDEASLRATAPALASVPAHGFYLFASQGYTGTVSADVGNAWSSGFASAGGHVMLRDSAGAEIDRLGWGTAMHPRTAACVVSAGDETYERKARMTSSAESMSALGEDATGGNGYDSGNNLDDFVLRAVRGPQNASSAIEVP